MAEEEVNLGAEQGEKQEAPQYNDVELKALDMGWKPKDQFAGEESDFVEAKEYIGRQKLFDKIAHQNREIRSVREALEGLKTHYTAVRETEYKRAIAALKAERKTALSEGDGERFEAIDDEIKAVETQVTELKKVQTEPVQEAGEAHPEFQAWKEGNSWYSSVGYMRKWADDFGATLASKGVPPTEVLKQVSAAVKKEFPHKFSNPNRAHAPNVESGASGTTRTPKDSFVLTEQENKVMQTLLKAGIKDFTKEKYIAELKAVKGL